MREMRRSATSGVERVQVGDLAPADDLHPVRMDVVQVADQVGGRLRGAHRGLVEAALRVRVPGDPLPVQRRAVFLEQRLGADDGRFHVLGSQRGYGDLPLCDPATSRPASPRAGAPGPQATDFSGSQAAIMRCTSAASPSVFRRSRNVAVGQHLGDLGQDLEVALRRRFRHQQEDQQADRLVVRRIERDRLPHPQHRRERVLQALDATVRDRDAVAEAGRAEALAREQVVGDGRAGDRVLVLEQQAGVLERALLAGGVDVDRNVDGGQDGGEAVHRADGRAASPASPSQK